MFNLLMTTPLAALLLVLFSIDFFFLIAINFILYIYSGGLRPPLGSLKGLSEVLPLEWLINFLRSSK